LRSQGWARSPIARCPIQAVFWLEWGTHAARCPIQAVFWLAWGTHAALSTFVPSGLKRYQHSRQTHFLAFYPAMHLSAEKYLDLDRELTSTKDSTNVQPIPLTDLGRRAARIDLG